MWRALFFSIGVMLIVVGLECTVVRHFTISNDAHLPDFVNEMIANQQAPRVGGSRQKNVSSEIAPPQSIPGYGNQTQMASQFGKPSRFSQSSFGNDQFFADRNTNRHASQRKGGAGQFSLAGYGAQSRHSSKSGTVKATRVRQIFTRDWMPWSLIAAGTIVVLYTKSLGRFDFSGSGDG